MEAKSDQKKWLHALSQAAGDYARAWAFVCN